MVTLFVPTFNTLFGYSIWTRSPLFCVLLASSCRRTSTQRKRISIPTRSINTTWRRTLPPQITVLWPIHSVLYWMSPCTAVSTSRNRFAWKILSLPAVVAQYSRKLFSSTRHVKHKPIGQHTWVMWSMEPYVKCSMCRPMVVVLEMNSLFRVH